MTGVKHIFFDLDHTLWDFDLNSAETLTELFDQYNLGDCIESSQTFVENYQRINARFWKMYREGNIEKAKLTYIRFMETFELFGMQSDRDYAEKFASDYLARCPLKTHVFPTAIDTLQALKARFPLHIITNGFKEVQSVKMSSSGLDKFFDVVLYSEDVGVNKPDPRVFEKALELANAKNTESVMIGDNLDADIIGAENVGMKTIFFNPQGTVVDTNSKQIYQLSELIEIFDQT
ncbi:YjjG family noncanonical pyrimidine nucleotidase [Crocinitomix catalasitica]|nr:YjjG family noncanonical pyrimidine nucleotidase [Crocinitomix catalasitica]